VIALKNGTMGWHLAGLQVRARETKEASARKVLGGKVRPEGRRRHHARIGVKKIDLAAFRQLEPAPVLYRLDVRDPAEYARATSGLPPRRRRPARAGDRSICRRPQRADRVHDNDGVRATMTAHWLMQMGWAKIYVLDHKPAAGELTTEAEPRFPRASPCRPRWRPGGGAPGRVAHEPGDRSRHQPQATATAMSRVRGSQCAPHSRVPSRRCSSSRRAASRIVLVSPDGEIAALAAAEAEAVSGGIPWSYCAAA